MAILRYLIYCNLNKYKEIKIKINNFIYQLGDLFVKFEEINNIKHTNMEKIYWGRIVNGRLGHIDNRYFLNSTDISAPKNVSIHFIDDVARIFRTKLIYDQDVFVKNNQLNDEKFELNKDYFLYAAVFGKLHIDKSSGKKSIVISDPYDLRYIVYGFIKKDNVL